MAGRQRTKYPGVYYREAGRLGGKGLEKVYYVVFKRGGQTHEQKVGRQYADNMTPAKASNIRADLIEGRRLTRSEVKAEEEARCSIAKIWDEFQIQKSGNKSLRDDVYRYNKELTKPFGAKTVDEIVTLDVDRMRRKLINRGLNPATVKQYLVLLKRIINFGVHKGLCPPPDPAGLRFEPVTINNEKTEDLTQEELARLLHVLHTDNNRQVCNLMLLALFTGMRRGELFRLKWEHADHERGHIKIIGPKGGVDQVIPMNQSARELLERHHRTDGSPYVFPGRGGRERKDIKTAINRIKKAAQLPADFRPLHGLRHVFASALASSGKVDMYQLQRLLTHKSPQMTQRYAHLRDEALKKAADVAVDAFQYEGDRNEGGKLKKSTIKAFGSEEE